MTALRQTFELFAKRHVLHPYRPVTSNRFCRSVAASSMSPTTFDITAPPAADQHIVHNGKEYTTVREGLAYILIPAGAAKTPQTTPKADNQPQSVFYNPIQQFNRDLSVLAIKAFGEELIERKKKSHEIAKKRQAANKEKKNKRKRGNDGVGSEPRKVGRMGDADGQVEGGPEAAIQKASNKGAGIQSIEEERKTNSAAAEQGETAEATVDAGPGDGTDSASARDVTMADVAETPETASIEAKREPYAPPFQILDALSATGLRALRYAHEIPFTTLVTANDLLATATASIKLNVEHNNLGNKITPVTGNALNHMYSLVGDSCKEERGNTRPSKKYDVIDLDPYGTAAPFLDAAVQAVRDDGGLLCVTCTDAAVWAGNGYPEKCFSLYGGTPMKGVMSHEAGIRLILHAIASSAARYGMVIEPLLSLSIDFYARVFVRVTKSALDLKFLAGKTMVVSNCDDGCGAFRTQMIGRNKLAPDKNGQKFFWKHVLGQASLGGDECEHCGKKTHMAGPMYAGPIHSPEFINRILKDLPNVSRDTYKTTDRIEGMLNIALEEIFPIPEDSDSPTAFSKTKMYDHSIIDLAPFFFIPSALAKVVHCVTPHENAMKGALRRLGYWCTRSHAKPGSIKTNAPWDVLWEVMREWVKQKAPIKKGALRENTAGIRIMGWDKRKNAETNGTNGKDSNVDAGDENAGLASKDEDAEGKDRKNGTFATGKDASNDTPAQKEKLEIVFDEQLGREKDTRKLVRYQINPRENWGPMNRAKGPK